MAKTTGAILLAAGYSNRFGGIKLLSKLKSGSSVIQQTFQRLSPAVDQVLVVTRPELADAVSKVCPNLLVFERAHSGMGATLAYGASNMPDWDSVLVCLADMPFIDTETYHAIAAASLKSNIIVPTYSDKKANPVAFGRKYFPELMRLGGDSGAKDLLQRHKESVIKLPLDDKGLLDDIDTQDDLARLQVLKSSL